VRGAGIGGTEGLGPVRGTEPDVGVRRLDLHALGRRLLVQPDRRLDRRDHVGGRLQPGHLRVGLLRRGRTLGEEVAKGADLHAVLAETREDVGDVGEVGLVRADEQHSAPLLPEAGVRVEQVRRTVQRHHGLAGAGAAVHDERAARCRADDGVLVGLDGAEHVPHPG
jgi:hypothetical protein